MRVEDLHHKELLELDPDGGVIRFAGQRALLLDAVAIEVMTHGGSVHAADPQDVPGQGHLAALLRW